MEILFKKGPDELEEYIIPKENEALNDTWVYIRIDFKQNEFIAKKIDKLEINISEWQSKSNLTVPSFLLKRFLNPVIYTLEVD